jgi:hypothetical protein
VVEPVRRALDRGDHEQVFVDLQGQPPHGRVGHTQKLGRDHAAAEDREQLASVDRPAGEDPVPTLTVAAATDEARRQPARRLAGDVGVEKTLIGFGASGGLVH